MMTSAQPMTREELLEYAALDAFGLLDEYDAALYTRWFHHAPATVQDEIKRLQAELVTDPSLMTVHEEPPTALRERVLAAVAAARERDEAQLAPLAMIGRPRAAEGDYQPRRMRFAGGGLFLRAACLVLAATALVLGYQWSAAVEKNAHMAELVISKGVEDQLRELMGAEFADLVKTGNTKGNIRAIALRQGNAQAQAMLYFNEANGTAFLLGMGLPASDAYSLHVSINGQPTEVKRFASNGMVAAVKLEGLDADAMKAITWEIRDADNQRVLYT